MGRIKLNRTAGTRQLLKDQKDGVSPIRFADIEIHDTFTLQHPKYINMVWLKMTKTGASPYNWDDDSSFAKQRFAQDDLVYLRRRNRE